MEESGRTEGVKRHEREKRNLFAKYMSSVRVRHEFPDKHL